MLHIKQTFIANVCENTSLGGLAGIPVLYCWQQEQQNKEIPVVRFSFVSDNNSKTRFDAQRNTFTFPSQEEIGAKCCRQGSVQQVCTCTPASFEQVGQTRAKA